MQKHHGIVSSYHFKRSKSDGVIQVLNEGSYVMAEYSERTGLIKWQRVVLATQKDMIEKWLGENYPIRAKAAVDTKRKVAPRTGSAAGQA